LHGVEDLRNPDSFCGPPLGKVEDVLQDPSGSRSTGLERIME